MAKLVHPGAAIPPGFLPAREAAARLGVRLASLYAYVSRGAVRVVAHPSDPRARLYAATDIDALIARKARGRRPALAAATALDWGLPVLSTAISRIADGRLFYRELDAIDFSQRATLEDVARLLWQRADDPFARAPHLRTAQPASLPGSPPQRAIASLAAMLPRDARREPGVAQAVAIVREVVATVTETHAGGGPIHEQLATAWHRRDAADIVRRALVLVADHELNASTFAARVAASTGASLTAAVIAALAAFTGPRHGGATQASVAFLKGAIRREPDADHVVRRRPAEALPTAGFGHPLYPDGDPRARALFVACPPEAKLRAILGAAERRAGLFPNLDMALASAQLTCRLPEYAAFSIFMVARTVGWLAHALEQQAGGKLIRPRATYLSGMPAD